MTHQPPPVGPAPAPPPRGYRPAPMNAPMGYPPPPNSYAAPPAFRPAPPPNTMTWTGPGYPVAAGARPAAKHSSHTKVIGILVAALLVAVAAFVGIGLLVTPGPASNVVCPPTCPNPPVGKPVASPETFHAADGTFSVTYLPAGPKVTLTKTSNSVDMRVTPSGETDEIYLTGYSASGRTAEQIVTAAAGKLAPDGRVAYVLPNAMVGFQPGYGVVIDNYLQTTTGATEHDRLIIIAAVKHDTALVAIGLGPYHQFSPNGITDGHPSGADSIAALLMDDLVNSFTWKGDPPR